MCRKLPNCGQVRDISGQRKRHRQREGTQISEDVPGRLHVASKRSASDCAMAVVALGGDGVKSPSVDAENEHDLINVMKHISHSKRDVMRSWQLQR